MNDLMIEGLAPAMIVAAEKLQEGGILFVYQDDEAIRMETVEGEDPYVWRYDTWVPMRNPD